ncbi:MAG: TAT-variant-translocated molybdopterin oxidoreductase [Melioribacteraceae bacterium]|jgi:MoCo/4Fe-4S cofactor protein with predicted Tat translocation signal|nr:TAT-variant-translocated molybdopterin oxidoreductase [Melioribacteraceae bacterium]
MSEENKKYWKSLDSFNDPNFAKETIKHEFQEGVTDEFNISNMSGVSRRKFIGLLTASTAIAATACSDYHDQKEIVPYTNRPEGVLPGKPNYYASTCNGCAEACGILIKTREGRPIKVDGNDEHPINKGKICATGQSSIYNLYDPSRLQNPLKGNTKTTWADVDSQIIKKLDYESSKGKKIVVLTNSINSPTERKMLDEFKQRFTSAEIHTFDLFNNCHRKYGWFKSYGNADVPSIKWDEANIILSLEGDFLGKEGNFIENTRLFSSKRDFTNVDNFNRLYVVEAGLSLTGSNSDYRMRLKPEAQYDFVMALLNEVIKKGASNIVIDSRVKNKLSKFSLDSVSSSNGLDSIKINYLVEDLIKNKGKSIIYAGDSLSGDVHIAVNLLNEILGNSDLYNYETAYVNTGKQLHFPQIEELIKSYNNNDVGVVIHYDVNPSYHLPESLKYDEALGNVGFVVSLLDSVNESTKHDYFTLPINHAFESWGDAHSRKNVYSLRQPVIAPLFNSRQKEAILLTWILGSPKVYNESLYHDYLMESCRENIYSKKKVSSDFISFWNAALHDGYINIDDNKASRKPFNISSINISDAPKEHTGFSVLLAKDYFIGDGRFANNGWLQEIPHPISKVAWDNYAAIAPSSAGEMNLQNGDMIKVTVGDNSVEIPIMLQPGVAKNTVVIELGYGRTVIGDAGKEVGHNANDLLNVKSKNSRWICSNATVEPTGNKYEIFSTQEHHSLEDDFVKDIHHKRGIIREASLDEYSKDPAFAREQDVELFSITEEHAQEGEKWAMSIDMNKCTSCAVCVASCNVENNIPVVGKDQVAVGREMHWMRIDRYYSGSSDDPIVSNQPMLCQHCDNAPCENVCPVNATNHSPDGLNQMVYNRCVGTRYCANNCSYKVRRFNFYNFRDHFVNAYYLNEVSPLVHNPEVTVRSRGVMEKCSFCVQKISEEREDAIREGRQINGDNVSPACQQACPADAIVFGDANNPESKISQYRKHELGYGVLQNLNVKPNVTYVAKLRNTHSEDV